MILEAKGLVKSFDGKRRALDGVDLVVEEREIYGLLGHNGAGKSTALGIMLGLVAADEGEVMVDGASVQRERATAMRKVGAIFESPAFYDYLSGWRNLKILASYSGVWDKRAAEAAVELVGLKGREGEPVRNYSHGMRQRLALAQALLPEPKVLLLDEPTDGLDPAGIKEFREMVLRLRDERGLTVLINSHLLGEVEQMCGRFAVLKAGKKVYEGDGSEVLERNEWRLVIDDAGKAGPVLGPLGVKWSGGERVEMPDGLESGVLVKALVEAGIGVREIAPVKPSLEELYLAVSGSAG